MIFNQYRKIFMLLKKLRTFRNSNEPLEKYFRRYGKIINVKSKKNLPSEFDLSNNKIYILIQGMAFLSCLGEDGRKIIFDILEEGSIVGDLDFLNDGKHNSYNCLYIEPLNKDSVIIYEFGRENFLNVISQKPVFALYILSDFSRRISRLEKKIEELAFSRVRFRILYELIKLSESLNGSEYRFKMNVKITHEKLAEVTGVVRETISKTLAQLKKEGIVYYDENKNLIIDLESKRGTTEYSFLNTSSF